MTFREAIRKAISDEMTADKNVVLFGEDIGVYGGCFKVTEGLWKDHPDQVIDTPVSEEGFTGMAVGAAMMGLRPIVEIMYADFFTLVFDPIVNHAAKTHFMSGGQFCCPITVRLPEGSGTGHGAQHTQSPEGLFLNGTGLKLVAPSNPSDAYHLLRASIRDNNPVLFFEHKLLYPLDGEISPTPVPIGKARIIGSGQDLTIISYSHAVITALHVSELLHERGIDSTVIDLRTLNPLDTPTILHQVRKTGRAVLLQDPNGIGGINAQICAAICQDAATFRSLKSPILQFAGKNTPIPFSKDLERLTIPQPHDIVVEIEKLF